MCGNADTPEAYLAPKHVRVPGLNFGAKCAHLSAGACVGAIGSKDGDVAGRVGGFGGGFNRHV